mgnify:CR=1 FL=1
MLKSLARWCYRRRWLVLGAWLVILIGCFAVSSAFGGESRTEFALPGSETQEAVDLLQRSGFDTQAGLQAQIVFQNPDGFDDPAVRDGIEAFLAQVEATVPDSSMVSPYSEIGARQVSEDSTIAYAEFNLAERDQEGYLEAGEDVRELYDDVAIPGTTVELGGDIFAEFSEPSSELIGIGAAILILLIAFGSLFAMGLPIITALFGVGSGVALIGLVANVIAVPDFTPAAAAMIGIGVGIDYALFIVTRFRQGLRDGLDPESATALAIHTAGRAVIFAGITVVISVSGLLAMDLDTFRAVAAASALAVLMTMLAAITLLPALLGFARDRIDKISLPGRKHAEGDGHEGFWVRWSHFIQARPWPPLLIGLTLLLVLSIPLLDLRLGFADAGNRKTTDTTRRAYDLLSDGFGPGFNSPLILAAALPNGVSDLAALESLSGTLNQTEGIAFAAPPQPNEANTAALLFVVPSSSPQDAETQELVERLRADVVPDAMAGTNLDVKVGGAPAAVEDFAKYTSDRMPLFFGAVLLLSFILLMVVFRSILVPLKAVIMNLLSLGASFGVIVAVFQWGWGGSLIGLGKEGPIEAWAPLMIFAIVFGLSMDYEVFLLSRIREEYDRTGNNATAVADGLANTARVITAAALIMVCVFGSFVLGDERSLKMLGFGMAIAVFIDATIVRMVLVPATMELLGDRNWWIPRWLGRILPNISFEGSHDELATKGRTSPTPTPTAGGDD